jgi:hypothetical protein
VHWVIDPDGLLGMDWFSKKIVATGSASRIGLIEIRGIGMHLQ